MRSEVAFSSTDASGSYTLRPMGGEVFLTLNVDATAAATFNCTLLGYCTEDATETGFTLQTAGSSVQVYTATIEQKGYRKIVFAWDTLSAGTIKGWLCTAGSEGL